MVITTKEMYSEVYSILKMLGKEYMEKLPKTILKIIIESREENYNPKYDLSIPLKNQDINRKSISMITLLQYNYWCETQEEKSKLKKMLEENEEKYQKEIKEKYSNDKIFNNKNIENKIEEKESEEKVEVKNDVFSNISSNIVEYKQSFFSKIIDKIKKIFKIFG